jgi:hypothetical protein
MAKDTITLEISQDFYDWWREQPYHKDQGLMYVAWKAWKACEIKYEKYNKSLEPTEEAGSLSQGS